MSKITSKRPLKGRDFISLSDFSQEELYQFWDTAAELKRKQKRGEPDDPVLNGKAVAMLFEWPSTRTRTSFEVGVKQLGGQPIYYSKESYWAEGQEPVKDTARVLSRYVNGLVWRCFKHANLIEMAKYADIPVINANSDFEHPCQVMADLMTTREKKGKLEGVKTVIAWAFTGFPKPIGIVNSTLFAGSKIGMDITVACPEGYDPDREVMDTVRKSAEESGSEITITRSLNEAMDGADVIHIKGWSPPEIYRQGFTNMKPPHVVEPEKYKKWMIIEDLVDLAKKNVIVQHALPVVRGEETTDAVMEGEHSVIFDEAENRLHAQKGVLSLII